jgi:hypothetical protein
MKEKEKLNIVDIEKITYRKNNTRIFVYMEQILETHIK